ncbi:MAG: hypothetical protein JXJ22_04690 [Bacteroidales bacterium]|nr:hypothetical protein [Bacteroidales bacterium]
MKRFKIVLILLLPCTLYLYGQEKQIFIIPAEYTLSQSQALQFFKGDTLIIQSDSVFLINSSRYNFYRNLHTSILEEKTSVCNELLTTYEKRLAEYSRDYEKLLENCKKTEGAIDVLQQTRQQLSATEKTLEGTIDLLNSTQQKLDEANKIIESNRKKCRSQKFLTGIAGVGIGLLVGILVGS